LGYPSHQSEGCIIRCRDSGESPEHNIDNVNGITRELRDVRTESLNVRVSAALSEPRQMSVRLGNANPEVLGQVEGGDWPNKRKLLEGREWVSLNLFHNSIEPFSVDQLSYIANRPNFGFVAKVSQRGMKTAFGGMDDVHSRAPMQERLRNCREL
jgi:hypothetical protein